MAEVTMDGEDTMASVRRSYGGGDIVFFDSLTMKSWQTWTA